MTLDPEGGEVGADCCLLGRVLLLHQLQEAVHLTFEVDNFRLQLVFAPSVLAFCVLQNFTEYLTVYLLNHVLSTHLTSVPESILIL